jgi:hypothetical protein
MFMIMEVNERFSFEAKARADRNNPRVQEWENLMWKFQQALPEAKPGEKWLQMCGSPIRMDSPGRIFRIVRAVLHSSDRQESPALETA